MKQTIEKSSEQMGRVLKLKADGSQVRQKIDQIVSDCIDVDMASCNTSHSSPAVGNKPNGLNSTGAKTDNTYM